MNKNIFQQDYILDIEFLSKELFQFTIRLSQRSYFSNISYFSPSYFAIVDEEKNTLKRFAIFTYENSLLNFILIVRSDVIESIN